MQSFSSTAMVHKIGTVWRHVTLLHKRLQVLRRDLDLDSITKQGSIGNVVPGALKRRTRTTCNPASRATSLHNSHRCLSGRTFPRRQDVSDRQHLLHHGHRGHWWGTVWLRHLVDECYVNL
jgi:hypothetical protein